MGRIFPRSIYRSKVRHNSQSNKFGNSSVEYLLNLCSLAGMLHKVGLLPAGNFQQVPFAYKMYTRADDVGWEQSTEFKKAFSVDVEIEFVGVWYVWFHPSSPLAFVK